MRKKLLFLDGLRGIAALYVVAHHARWLLWEGFGQGYYLHPEKYSVADKALMWFFSIFKWGHEFVLFFFVLSGFVIHLKYANKLAVNPMASLNWTEYLYKRAKRIYPPFILALFLTLLLDFTGNKLGFTIYSGTSSYTLINENIGASKYGLSAFVGNLLFIYNEYVPLFGTNGPAWSLKFEWWFYLVYPVFLFFSRKQIWYSTAAILLLFIFSFFKNAWPEQLLRGVFSSMICWWLGVLLAESFADRILIKLPRFSILCTTGFLLLFLFPKNDRFHDLQISFLFSAILGYLLWLNENNKNLKLLEKLAPVGNFSYTLYIIHFPILVFLSGIVMKINGNKLPVNSFIVIAGIVFCVAIAYVFHFIVEIPFIKEGVRRKSKLSPAPTTG